MLPSGGVRCRAIANWPKANPEAAESTIVPLKLSPMRRTLLKMPFSRFRLKTLPFPLRWLLAIALILNGAVAPPVMAHAAMAEGHGTTAYAVHIVIMTLGRTHPRQRNIDRINAHAVSMAALASAAVSSRWRCP